MWVELHFNGVPKYFNLNRVFAVAPRSNGDGSEINGFGTDESAFYVDETPQEVLSLVVVYHVKKEKDDGRG